MVAMVVRDNDEVMALDRAVGPGDGVNEIGKERVEQGRARDPRHDACLFIYLSRGLASCS